MTDRFPGQNTTFSGTILFSFFLFLDAPKFIFLFFRSIYDIIHESLLVPFKNVSNVHSYVKHSNQTPIKDASDLASLSFDSEGSLHRCSMDSQLLILRMLQRYSSSLCRGLELLDSLMILKSDKIRSLTFQVAGKIFQDPLTIQ